ncbi:MAG TPA: hydrogenase nickel incorporation protein HypB [Thermoanaerobaculales bacterium]|nr:hydrogenase nickel incorporation protein HypB [Thermoanaerobaculales bacterium]HPA81556.1 hydrogenase nickel incorporation protein HypB [Thermoanaerobaculales bacterium]HQL30998.1 hydrogenase nickel incorporation protein HypB [Thermoanaerobaculales bacterium]HQN95826.1 hydrogenase nickel incorporation protein HypB [Thermoanaerobaculales bacterium]HQP43739.1 hydrogenase nickel incorporation protein HypB [Thermoanaerobaculales bacterium]
MTQVITVRRRALAASEDRARLLRERFAQSGTLVVNLISAPGSGKTTLLEATLRRLTAGHRCAVIEGDVATERDADRIRALGVPAHQILTGGACHLDARQVEAALATPGLPPADILFIENVGNLICPTAYDLGEDLKVAVLSVAEGDDKPFKYPAIFARAAVTVISKIDLLPHLTFDVAAVEEQLRALNPGGTILTTSAVTAEGVDAWCDLLVKRLADKRRASAPP